MKKYINRYSNELQITPEINKAINEWVSKLDKNELESEKNNYINFFDIILRDILGYSRHDILYEENIGREGRPVEFVLTKEDKELVVVELKGTKTKDLDKRHGIQSPMEQATNYASIKEDTKWAIVSNFDEFRLFNPSYREKYISFNFKELIDENILKEFLLCFSKLSLIDKEIPQKLLEETKLIEEDIEDEFYKLFSETRLMLIKELEQDENNGREESIRLSQLILNRYIFCCFAEDIDLIPPETTTDVLETPLKHGNLSKSKSRMWGRLNELFEFIDEGNEIRGISAFNGGLFKEDLSHLKIRDFVEDLSFFEDCYKKWSFEDKYEEIKEIIQNYKNVLNPIYKNLLVMSAFDFSSELDVNILGHIFENSIGDIEELKDQSKTRRKKDGVFYTPDYITDYICRNTIIPYLSKSGESTTVNDLISEYNLGPSELLKLDKKLKEIKIIDPACGSGAFLNKAADLLLEIHEKLSDMIYANRKDNLDYLWDSIDVRREILINNIYGVDINNESVDITKLAMFLKVAKKGLKLPNLDKNIKCGNSLIDNSDIAGDKAFNWEEEFKEVFGEGGFDVVIGNPPYVRQELINSNEKTFLKENYESCTDSTNLFVGFFEKSLKVLKNSGLFSVICSNKFATVDYGKNLREYLLNYDIIQYCDLTGEDVFDDAEVDPCIIIVKKDKSKDNNILVDSSYNLPQTLLSADFWFFSVAKEVSLKQKLLESGTPLNDLKDIEINNGIKTGYNKAFYIDNETKDVLINKDINNAKIIKPLLVGKDIKPYGIDFREEYLIFARQGIKITDYPFVEEYLSQFKEDLTPKSSSNSERGRKPGDYEWYEIQDKTDFYENFEKPKLIWAEMNKEISFCYDDEGYYVNNKCFIITSNEVDLKFLNGLFLSKLFHFIFKSVTSSLGENSYELRKSYVKKVPIILSSTTESLISSKVDTILNYNKQIIVEKVKFIKWLKRTFDIENLSKKLTNCYSLSFEDFLNEIKKENVNIKSRKIQELLEYEFNNSLEIIKSLQLQIG
ncbi:MAG: N-6 DNA methylase, partial [archaeon]|nr:N-6 DNA methylase [archaeon]